MLKYEVINNTRPQSFSTLGNFDIFEIPQGELWTFYTLNVTVSAGATVSSFQIYQNGKGATLNTAAAPSTVLILLLNTPLPVCGPATIKVAQDVAIAGTISAGALVKKELSPQS